MSSKEKKPFAKGLCFDKILIVFVIGCMIGTYYEEILTIIKTFIKTNEIIWQSRRGVIYGPFNPLYGFALAFLTIVFARNQNKDKKSILKTFLLASILGGAIEYVVSYFQEMIVGTVSWDYSKKFLNINGRTTIPFMFFWGLCTSLYIYKIYPFLSRKIEQIPQKIGKIIVLSLTIFLSFDMLISLAAVYRQDQRRQNIPPKTVIGEFIDNYYTDEFLSKCYPNMQPVK